MNNTTKKKVKVLIAIIIVLLGIISILIIYTRTSETYKQRDLPVKVNMLKMPQMNQLIGQKIGGIIDSLPVLRERKSNIKNKIVVLPDISSCQPCYEYVISYFTEQLRKSKLESDAEVLLVIPSRNLEYAKNITQKIVDDVIVAVDTSFFFRKYSNLENYTASILLINKSNICIYSSVLLSKNEEKIKQNFLEIVKLIKN